MHPNAIPLALLISGVGFAIYFAIDMQVIEMAFASLVAVIGWSELRGV